MLPPARISVGFLKSPVTRQRAKYFPIERIKVFYANGFQAKGGKGECRPKADIAVCKRRRLRAQKTHVKGATTAETKPLVSMVATAVKWRKALVLHACTHGPRARSLGQQKKLDVRTLGFA